MGRPVGTVAMDKTKALELYNLGMTDVEIGNTLGKGRQTIYQFRQRRNLPANLKPKPKQVKARGAYKDALRPHQIDEMKRFLSELQHYAKLAREAGKRINVGAFMDAWRDEWGRVSESI